MIKNTLFSLVFILSSLFFTLSCEALPENKSTEWKIWQERPTLKISYRPHKNTGLLEVDSYLITNSTLSGFLLFLQDTSAIPMWLDNAYKSDIIRQISANENIFITYFNGFWPVKPRNMIIQTKYYQDDSLNIHISVKDAAHALPEIPDSIRVNMIDANWLITPLSKTQIKISYRFIVDPNGAIPHWLVNKFALKAIEKTLLNINEQLPSSPWQEYQLSGITEKTD